MWGREAHEDIVEITTWMQQLAREPVDEPPLPDPTVLWLKAQMLRRWDAQQQAVVRVEIGERVQAGLAAVACVLLLALLWRNVPAVSSAPAAVPILAISTLVLVAAAAFTAWDSFVKEK